MPQQQDYPATFRDGSFTFVAGRSNSARLTESRLRGSSYPELRGVRCDHHEGVLTLRGTVSNFYMTQLAQALAARIPGVEEVVNRIEVKETATCSFSADR